MGSFEQLRDFGIEVLPTSGKGKGLFALKAFKAGEIAFTENPIVSCQFPWNQDAGYKACDHCLRPLETAEENARSLCRDDSIVLPFPDNSPALSKVFCSCGAVYCSPECMEVARGEYHERICVLPESPGAEVIKKVRNIWKQMHYPPEESTIMLCLRMFSYLSCPNASKVSCLREMLQDGMTDAVTAKLLGRFKKEVDELTQALTEFCQFFNFTSEMPCTEKLFLSALGLMALNSQGIGTSALSAWWRHYDESADPEVRENADGVINAIYEIIEERVGLDFMNIEGIGVYEIQHLINHSCEPNLEVTFPFNNHQLALRVIADISPGEELTTSYLDDCQIARSRHSRQKILRERHLFNCVCAKCESEVNQPDETSEEDEDDEISM